VNVQTPRQVLDTGDALVLRVNGKPRDVQRGGRMNVVVYIAAGVSPARLALLLRAAADCLDAPGA
jgi:hypothetical protein